MYYVWEIDLSSFTDKFAFFNEKPDGYDYRIWSSLERMEQDPPYVTLIGNRNYPTLLSDVLLCNDLPVFSPKVVQLFDRIGIQDIDYYPVTVINHETGDADTSYKAAHITCNIPCLDFENSELEYYSDGEGLIEVYEFSILEDKIPQIDELGRKPLIFRLAEFKFHILADELVKNEFEKEGITGIKFTKPSEWV